MTNQLQDSHRTYQPTVGSVGSQDTETLSYTGRSSPTKRHRQEPVHADLLREYLTSIEPATEGPAVGIFPTHREDTPPSRTLRRGNPATSTEAESVGLLPASRHHDIGRSTVGIFPVHRERSSTPADIGPWEPGNLQTCRQTPHLLPLQHTNCRI